TRAEGSGVVAGGAVSHLNPQLQSMCMVRSPKIDRWSSRSHIRERTLQNLRSAFGIALCKMG
ncbi:MAG: hypothetical protein ACKPHT_06195, partial [Microcystis panniformis]